MTLQGIVSNFDDADLVPGNIKDQADIFGVVGNYSGWVVWWWTLEIVWWDPSSWEHTTTPSIWYAAAVSSISASANSGTPWPNESVDKLVVVNPASYNLQISWSNWYYTDGDLYIFKNGVQIWTQNVDGGWGWRTYYVWTGACIVWDYFTCKVRYNSGANSINMSVIPYGAVIITPEPDMTWFFDTLPV